jgi:hypothetical protein
MHPDIERLKEERNLSDKQIAYYDVATLEAMVNGDYG